MQALLYLIDTEDDLRRAIAVCSTKKLKIVYRKYHRKLDEDVVNSGGFNPNSGGYGSHCILGLGATFGDRWMLTGIPDPRGKPFTGLRVHFVGTSWDMPRELQETVVAKAGGRVVDKQERANVIVVSNRQPAKLGACAAVLIVTEEVFRRALRSARLISPVMRREPLNVEVERLLSATAHYLVRWWLIRTEDNPDLRPEAKRRLKCERRERFYTSPGFNYGLLAFLSPEWPISTHF
jgi:hypothetical protein